MNLLTNSAPPRKGGQEGETWPSDGAEEPGRPWPHSCLKSHTVDSCLPIFEGQMSIVGHMSKSYPKLGDLLNVELRRRIGRKKEGNFSVYKKELFHRFIHWRYWLAFNRPPEFSLKCNYVEKISV